MPLILTVIDSLIQISRVLAVLKGLVLIAINFSVISRFVLFTLNNCCGSIVTLPWTLKALGFGDI